MKRVSNRPIVNCFWSAAVAMIVGIGAATEVGLGVAVVCIMRITDSVPKPSGRYTPAVAVWNLRGTVADTQERLCGGSRFSHIVITPAYEVLVRGDAARMPTSCTDG